MAYLHLPPNILEIKEPLFPHKPLRAPHSPFSEPASGLGVVAEINGVIGRIEHQFVHADDVAFAEGSDLNFGARVLLQDCLHGGGGAGGSIFFFGMVAFVDVSQILLPDGGSRLPDEVEKQTYADRKIRAEKKTSPALLDPLAYACQLGVPAGRAD